MFDFIDQIKLNLPLYFLVFARLSAMVVSMPIFGYSTIYSKLRILFVVVLTLVIAPMLSASGPIVYSSWLLLIAAIMKEILLGLIIGYGARMIFEGFTIAGAYVGMQIGFAVISVFDPSNQEQQPIISNFWFLVIITFFPLSRESIISMKRC
jgi:flagellar biosynthetic protein FliR